MKTYPLLVVMTNSVAFPDGSLLRPTFAEIKELEVWSSREVDELKEPVMGPFEFLILASLA
jgi:hypothetical protein